MDTSWCDDYIHDCLRYEPGKDCDTIELGYIHHLIEMKLQEEINKLIQHDLKFDTYDFFDKVKEDVRIMTLIKNVLVPVIDEE